jgi:hypothetical protein
METFLKFFIIVWKQDLSSAIATIEQLQQVENRQASDTQ